MTLAYYADERQSKRVIIKPEQEEGDSDIDSVAQPVCGDCTGESLESKIANEIGFPNDSEFNEIFAKMEKLREQGLRTEEGTPDGTRDVQLRITVEVL